MKHFRMAAYLFAAASMMFVPVACSDDDDQQQQGITDVNTPSGETNFTEETYAAYAAKYNVQDPNFEFESFEFLADGTYILTRKGYTSYVHKAEKPVVINSRKDIARLLRTQGKATRATDNYYYINGSYTVNSDGSFQLDDLGKIAISPDAGIVSLTDNSGMTITVSVNKAQPVFSGSNTQKLCRTWTLTSVEVWENLNGIQAGHGKLNYLTGEMEIFEINPSFLEPGQTVEEAKEEYKEDYLYNAPKQITFTPYGTCIKTYGNGISDLRTWEWSDEANATFYEEWNDTDEEGGYNNGHSTTSFTFNGKNAYAKVDDHESWKEDGETGNYHSIEITTLQAR